MRVGCEVDQRMGWMAKHSTPIQSLVHFNLEEGREIQNQKKEDMKGEREGGRRETKGGKERGKNREEDKYREA